MFKVAKRVESGGCELQDRAEWIWHGSNLILIVADGAGGMTGGAEAAEFMVEHIRNATGFGSMDDQGLNELFISADRQMTTAGKFGETTCVLVTLSDNALIGTSVGDSGAWLISEKGMDNLTANQCRKPFIGSGHAKPVGFSRGPIRGTLLLASDGLLKYASADQIVNASAAPDLDQAVEDLVKLVRYPSGALPDDVSIVLARDV